MDEKRKYTALLLAAVMVASVFAMTVPVSAAPVADPTLDPGPKSKLAEEEAGSNVSEGGYVTEMNLSVTSSTSKWQGYYGNVSGGIVLSNSAGTPMFQWAWDTGLGGEVLATTNNSVPPWGNLAENATEQFTKQITSLWNWTPASTSDNATMTLNSTTDVDIAGRSISMNCTAENALLQTEQGWLSGAVATATPNHKDNFTFVGIINNDSTAFDSTTKDYEMLVPVNETVGATETYYFYVEMS